MGYVNQRKRIGESRCRSDSPLVLSLAQARSPRLNVRSDFGTNWVHSIPGNLWAGLPVPASRIPGGFWPINNPLKSHYQKSINKNITETPFLECSLLFKPFVIPPSAIFLEVETFASTWP